MKTKIKLASHSRKHMAFRDRAYLLAEYTEKKRSTREIAREHSVRPNAVFHWLVKHGILRRTISEVRALKHWGMKGPANPMFGKCGAANPNYIDGSSPERQRIYANSPWKQLWSEILKRDDYKCVRCGSDSSRKNRLHGHHIKPWAGNPELRFEKSNIVSLCRLCHWFVHSRENVKNEFIA